MSGSRTELVLASEDLLESYPGRAVALDLGEEG